MPNPSAAMLVIGDEILSGRTKDANLIPVARGLGRVGVRLAEVRVVADDVSVIAETVNQYRSTHDYVFTSGGIGPTHDDVTVAAMALAFGVAVTRHEVLLPDGALRQVGEYEVQVRLHTDVQAQI